MDSNMAMLLIHKLQKKKNSFPASIILLTQAKNIESLQHI